MDDPEQSSDAERLIAEARAGDPAALQDLLIAHLGELQVFMRFQAGARLAARESVADLTQSLVADLLPELPRAEFDNVAAFRGWLRRAALHKLVDKHRFHSAERRQAAREESDLDLAEVLRTTSTPSQHALGREEVALLEQAMDLLPEEQRQVLSLTRLLGMSHREAAEVLGRSEPACRQLLRRAMVAVSREMERIDRPRSGH